MSTFWKVKKKNATQVGDVGFIAAYFLPFLFGFSSPRAFNLLEDEEQEEAGAEDEERRKKSG